MKKAPGYLTILVECMFAVASSDQSIAYEEMELILELVKTNWKDEYGEAKDFIQTVHRNIRKRSIVAGISLKEQFEHNAAYLGGKLNKEQKEHVIRVLHKLAQADRFIDQNEKELIEILKGKFDPNYEPKIVPENPFAFPQKEEDFSVS